ncbi:carcinoembryonic antigen-related cell adhesion molecule 5-like [Solea solea]|uniref:carcinoembryonic antigen-related cell adhesion molecule 5-like n=1 Tax=Solea solea TaxID=90069 RepID=UPI00272D1FD7|nr:carcinoembryonic antigen-related cell adhesion molecule 5-like [Solea solea]
MQSNNPTLKANTSITVFEPILNVRLEVNQTNLTELNSLLVMKCSVSSGSSPSFVWLNGSSEVRASDRVQLTDGNSTLNIVNVTRYDHGPFTCVASNPVSNGSSSPQSFNIIYGPDHMALTVNGSLFVGSNLTVLCSAQSNPPAQFEWTFRGESVNQTGPLLELYSVTEDQSGPYSCVGFNNHTNRNSSITSHITITSAGSTQPTVNTWLVSLLLLVMAAPVHGYGVYSQNIHASENPLPVGSNVTLYSPSPVSLGVWLFNLDLIVMIFGPNISISNTWKDRVAFNTTTSSLSIMSVSMEDSGVYTLDAMNLFEAQLTLSVQERISNVTMEAKATDLVEFNDTAILMCSASTGSSLNYVWLKDDHEVTAGGNVQLSDGNTTLTIDNVTRYDQGPFKCRVFNGISHETSPAVFLNISYGPSNTTMTVMPMQMNHIHRTASNITLSCTTSSSPSATTQWMVNGRNLHKYAPQIYLHNVTEDDSGNYKCVFHNPVTNRFSSASAMIYVLDPLESVEVNNTGGPAILDKSFSLHCDVLGSVDRVQWWQNWQLLMPDSTTTFSMNNKTLTLNPVQHSDNGNYKCQAFNSVSNLTSSPYTVQVNYGPEMPTIMGPTLVKAGTNVTFICNASSHPPSHYTWYFSDTPVATTAVYVTPPLTEAMSGMYMCQAYNNITGLNTTKHTMLTVVDPITEVHVESSTDHPREGYVYMLTCNVTGPADHVYWMKYNEEINEDTGRINIHNHTIMFNPLERNDTGHYKCMAVNAVGNMTSPTYNVLVNFGPDIPKIHGPAFVETGQYATFNCSAMSVPPSQFSWWFNDAEVANTSVYTTELLTLNMSGEYTCMAYNHVMGKNSTNSKMVTVIEAIESVMIHHDTLPINSENFTLSCEVTGPYDAIYWTKDDTLLNMNASASDTHMNVHTVNNTLLFTPVTVDDDGTYQCFATNKAARHGSQQYKLLVNYGPLSVSITGPSSAKPGVSVSLTCSADSRPDCDFHWLFNYTTQVVKVGSVITFPATKVSYTCEARNPVTNITKSKTISFTVFGHASALHLSCQVGVTLMSACALLLPVLFA